MEMQFSKAIEMLKREFNPAIIYLFGSAARNELREDSDIDIAFLTDNEVDSYKCFIKAQELADVFKRDVDLINLNASSTVFKAQVVLNDERKVILENIKKRGYIYGK